MYRIYLIFKDEMIARFSLNKLKIKKKNHLAPALLLLNQVVRTRLEKLIIQKLEKILNFQIFKVSNCR